MSDVLDRSMRAELKRITLSAMLKRRVCSSEDL